MDAKTAMTNRSEYSMNNPIYEQGYEDGYLEALNDLADLVRTDLYLPLTYYDEGVNTGLTKAIDVAAYLAQKMLSEGAKDDE